MDQQLITRIVEAALLASNQPLTLAQLNALFPEDQPPPADSVEQALEALREANADRGVELVEVASGFRFQVKADVHPWVARLWTERQTRYTRATLETLALIAYRQPITRGEIEQVRGVAVNSNIIKALEEREWIRVVGHRDVPGKPALFGTTKGFLDYFGLKRLDELPPLSELKDIGELEPQLQFEGAPIAAGGIATGEAEASNADDAGDDVEADDIGTDDDLGLPEAQADMAVTQDEDAPAEAADADTDMVADATIEDTDEHALEGTPEAAPGERAADVNDPEQDTYAVETTTVPEQDTDEAELAESEQQKHD
ncbi:segregation and condensation protein B [Lysobacter niastensis]|uniref:Segregation and condensation protein B n=1 Tax=Lysobacter niastensis TaxID=380629 RepID=A0ABU1W9W1_9GAMM|nr:SMC-Scp complex subunit ScpB [Lysobacter niastensis]MDR7134426.1 segregation and condensation protein B [Lysobacter niastensis]